MQQSELLNMSFEELLSLGQREHEQYSTADPFPFISLDNIFNQSMLRKILAEFPDLGDKTDIKFNNPNELKLASRGESKFGPLSTDLIHMLNSKPFLDFLTTMTGIKGLIPDPYLWGGGFHEIRRGGFLKIHSDFNKHPELQLDRRLNLLIYLNEHWEEGYGGHFELWDKDMKQCCKRILPVFNRMVVFSTTDFSFHGHPDPVQCPHDLSRKSIALYYYTNGRPEGEVLGFNRITTDFRSRGDSDGQKMKNYNRLVKFTTDLVPPAILKLYQKVK
jgi:2-oxoglutarate-Fe(II)-dependent oxygenase superfamily protein